MSKSQNLKSKFRSSKVWKEWRKRIYHRDNGLDYITGKKLYSGYNCHHMNLREEDYKNLREDHFISLNKNTHQCIHWAYEYYKKDHSFIERFREILDRMEVINA